MNWTFNFFDLDPILVPISTLEPLLDLNQIPESVLVPVYFTPKPKSTISMNHISLLDQSVGQYNSEMIYHDWAFDRDTFQDRILRDPIHFGGYKTFNMIMVKGEFLRTTHLLD